MTKSGREWKRRVCLGGEVGWGHRRRGNASSKKGYSVWKMREVRWEWRLNWQESLPSACERSRKSGKWFGLCPSGQFSSRGDFVSHPRKIIGKGWRHWELLQQRRHYWHVVGKAGDAAKHSSMNSTCPTLSSVHCSQLQNSLHLESVWLFCLKLSNGSYILPSTYIWYRVNMP